MKWEQWNSKKERERKEQKQKTKKIRFQGLVVIMDTRSGGLPSFSRQLNLLKYPERGSFDLYSNHSIKELVLWLENNVFEYLEESEKTPLIQQQGDDWRTGAFVEVRLLLWPVLDFFSSFFFFCLKYLDVLGSPFAFGKQLSDVQMATIVEWLLNYALGLKYQKNASQLNEASAQARCLVRAKALVDNGSLGQVAAKIAVAAGKCRCCFFFLFSYLFFKGLPEPKNELDARRLIVAAARCLLNPPVDEDNASKDGKVEEVPIPEAPDEAALTILRLL